jgi:hypothetical protein
VRLALASLALVASLLPGPASAGRRRFGWPYDTETVPERGVELETWVSETTGTPKTTWVRWMTVFGLTDELELALPIDLVWRDLPPPNRNRTALEEWGLEVRWRLASADPVEAGAFVPLVRLGVFRHVIDRDSVEVEGNLVLSLAFGPAYAVLDAGAELHASDDGDQSLLAKVALGLAVETATDLRVGFEAMFEHKALEEQELTWLAVGPVLSYTHGRIWLTGSLLIGLTPDAPDLLPRVLWGIAF